MGDPRIPTLTTERLVLRPFQPDDLDALVAIHAEESFWWYPRRGAMAAEETGAFLETVLRRYEDDGFGIEAVIERASGTMIGWAGLAVPHFLPQILPAVEVGWRLSGPYRGRGLATEAGAAAVEFGFAAAGLECIVSLYEPENVASGRVMQRLGFTHRLTTVGPRGWDVAVMELRRVRWEERRHRGDAAGGPPPYSAE
jgi:RimJ/RimL family protein N-acetyltransferase